MSLQAEIDEARREIRTDGYSVSIGEWISMYEKDELDIHPEFQRFFRWTNSQKSRFIESLILGIPVPPVFVAQRPEGTWDVVDGLQRLSTIYQLVGILKDEDGNLVEPLRLESTEYLPSLGGCRWEDEAGRSLEMSQRLLIKRAKIDVSIVLRESEERVKYELFQRLNTGGSQLSDQEVRNAILVMLNRDLYEWLDTLSKSQDFVESTALSDKALDERYDLELILRFLSLRRASPDELAAIGDLGDYLTNKVRMFATNPEFPKDEEALAFHTTFGLVNSCLGSEAFRRFSHERDRSLGGFLVSAYEAIALGVGWDPQNAHHDCDDLRVRARAIWTDDAFTSNSGSGVRASTRIPAIVRFGRERFQQ